MLDIAIIREQPDYVKQKMQDLFDEEAISRIDLIVELEQQRRALVTEVDDMRAQKNAASKQIGQTRDQAERQTMIDRVKKLSVNLEEREGQLRQVQSDLDELMLVIPNMPADDVPVGRDEESNVVNREEGVKPSFDFTPLPHWEIGEQLGLLDFERGVKLSGSRFYVLQGLGARLQRALITWMLDIHIDEHGYKEVYPPYMVRGECLVGTGNLPKFGENLYRDAEEDYWFIPTAEVPLTNLHREEILDPCVLPLKYVAYTPCFRREKMSAGRDVRGIKRGHQFDKVELVNLVAGDDAVSEQAHEQMLADAEEIPKRLGIPYRIIDIASGDLSFVAAKKYDIELWAAGSEEWLEVSSISNFRSFQARRAGLRYRPEQGAKPEFVHTLNGSALALPRLMIAIMENFQQADGSIEIPEVLHPYMHGHTRIPAATE